MHESANYQIEDETLIMRDLIKMHTLIVYCEMHSMNLSLRSCDALCMINLAGAPSVKVLHPNFH